MAPVGTENPALIVPSLAECTMPYNLAAHSNTKVKGGITKSDKY